jgi:diacylglycerol kinase (ATP)
MKVPNIQPKKLAEEGHALKSTGMFKRIFKAIGYSSQGMKAAWIHEAAFRTEVGLAMLAVVLAFITPLAGSQRFLLLACWVLVILVELLNSAIETAVDLISPGVHELAGRAKDIASAAVMVSVLFTLIVWGWIAVPVWWSLFIQ